MKKTPISILAAMTALALPIAGCSTTTDTAAHTITNCGNTITLNEAPTNVTLLNSAPVATLDALGVLDTVRNKAGQFPTEYYTPRINDALSTIPTLTDRLDPDGHLQISREQVVATNPDMIFGFTDHINHDSMNTLDIPVIGEPTMCGDIDHHDGFNSVYEQVNLYGNIYQRQHQANEYNNQLRRKVEELSTPADNPDDAPTVAILYPSTDGTSTYAYGPASMSHPIVEAAGLRNVFADQEDRVFEVNAEELINRNPDYIIALHTEGSGAETASMVTKLPGSTQITAVQQGHIMPLLLNFAEPPTPLAVTGLEKIQRFLQENQ